MSMDKNAVSAQQEPRSVPSPLPVAAPAPPPPNPPESAFESKVPLAAAAAGVILSLLGGGGWFDLAVFGSLFGFVAAWLVIAVKRR